MTSASFARIRFEMVLRLSQNRPYLVFPQKCVKPRLCRPRHNLGTRYSVPPGLSGVTMTLRQRLGTTTLDVVSPSGVVLVTHQLAPRGAGAMVRTPAHRDALEKAVLSQFTSARPCDRKECHAEVLKRLPR